MRTKVQGKMYALSRKMKALGVTRWVDKDGNVLAEELQERPQDVWRKEVLQFGSWCEGWKDKDWDGSLERPSDWRGVEFPGDVEEEDGELTL